METVREQERRARRRVRPAAWIKASLIAGLIVFVLPGGGPWMSYDTGIATMGRVLSANVVIAAAWQALMALAYGWAIAALVYSMPTLMGIITGTLVGVPLYALNYLLLRNGMGFLGNEVHAAIAHLTFALFFSAIYRAMAVSPPREVNP